MVCKIFTETGQEVRLRARNNEHQGPTSGLAPGYVQANMIVLPSAYASDFRNLCARNPVPCPLIAESVRPGCFDSIRSTIPTVNNVRVLDKGFDLRTDVPRYMVYRMSELQKSHCSDITAEWTEDHVAFLIGCSYSFEAELASAGLVPRHVAMGKNVPMYRTSVPLCPAGVFTGGTYVVSMRPYRRDEIEDVRRITRKYGATHGEPIAWGWDSVEKLGIQDVDNPEWGDAPKTIEGMPLGRTRQMSEPGQEDEEVPVFWGCGVTPQEAVMRAGLEGVVMAHAPGHMLLLDVRDEEITR